MTEEKRRLLLRLVRLFNAIDRIDEEAAEMYERDSLFDAGEFCGPMVRRWALGQQHARARQLGFRTVEVAYDVWSRVAHGGRS